MGLLEDYAHLHYKKKQYQARIKSHRKLMHKVFVRRNRKLLMMLDLMIVLCILMNFGAAFITSTIVIKDIPTEDIRLVEANPAAAEANNWKVHPEANEIMRVVYAHLWIWMIIGGVYISQRRTIYTEDQLVPLFAPVFGLFLMLGLDFFNDAGFYWEILHR